MLSKLSRARSINEAVLKCPPMAHSFIRNLTVKDTRKRTCLSHPCGDMSMTERPVMSLNDQ